MEDNSSASPSWLDKQFIQNVIRVNYNNPDVVVTHLDISAVVGKGENYASQLLRVTFQLQDGDTISERSLIIKSLPVAEIMQQLLVKCMTFEREFHMYQVTLPAMNRLFADHGCTLPSLSASSYATTRPRTIIMQDLTAQGYKMLDRHKGLDAVQSCLALKALARLHAASVVLLKRDPACMDMYHENYYCDENREWLVSLLEPMVKALTSQVSTWPGVEHFAEKLRGTLTVDNFIAFMKPQPTDTIVLNHGDPWMNNLLFKISPSGESTAVKFVDFQEMRLTSPVMDLQYFLYSSLREKMCVVQWHELLGVYHEEFVATLRMCGVEHVPEDLASVEALEKKMEEKIGFGLLTAATILPITLADTNAVLDFEKWEENEKGSGEVEQAGRMFLSVKFREIFQGLLPHFEEKGAFRSDKIPCS